MAIVGGFEFPDALHYLMAHDTWARLDDDEHMRQAAQFGAKLYACSDALAAQRLDRANLIPELAGLAGAAAFVERALDPAWATLVF